MLRDIGDYQKSADHLQIAVSLNPKRVDAWANLAVSYDKLHRTDDAIAAGQKALELARAKSRQHYPTNGKLARRSPNDNTSSPR